MANFPFNTGGPFRSAQSGARRGGGCGPRLMIALGIVAFSLFTYFTSSSKQENPLTGEVQRISLTTQQEVALGLQAAPTLIKQHGNLHPNPRDRELLVSIGNRLLQANQIREMFPDYKFDFHLLADTQTINAFALPGGQVFMTYALFSKLDSEDAVAGVIGHEIAHVVCKHSNQQITKQKLFQGVAMAVLTAGSDNPGAAQQAAGLVNAVLSTKYGRDDELESDKLGVYFMAKAGYNPEALITVMKVLESASGGRGGSPEFLSTHPNPGNRIERIKVEIERLKREGLTLRKNS